MAEMMNKMPAGAAPPAGGVVPRRDIKPLTDEIMALLGEGAGAGAAAGGMAGEMAGAEMGGMAGAEAGMAAGAEAGMAAGEMGADVAVIADALGVSMEKAQALYDAAMAMPKLAGKSPAEVASMLEKDMNLRMQLEKNMGAGEDKMARTVMAEEGMKAPPPMEPTPGPMKK
jgi:uncharacterized protein YcfJ